MRGRKDKQEKYVLNSRVYEGTEPVEEYFFLCTDQLQEKNTHRRDQLSRPLQTSVKLKMVFQKYLVNLGELSGFLNTNITHWVLLFMQQTLFYLTNPWQKPAYSCRSNG